MRTSVTLTFDVAKVFDEPKKLNCGRPDRLQRTSFNGTTIALSVSWRL